LDENLSPTSTNSVDPIIPYSSAPQLINIIVRRGRHPREKSSLSHGLPIYLIDLRLCSEGKLLSHRLQFRQ
jgi:hypothetical protein